MLWRPTYQTLAAYGVSTPALNTPTRCVLIGGFHFAAYRQMSVWKRLMASESAPPPLILGFFLPEPSAQDVALLESILPPSEQAYAFLFPDPEGDWKNLLAPEDEAQCFAAVLDEAEAKIMMKGIPTEDAWDAFREAFV